MNEFPQENGISQTVHRASCGHSDIVQTDRFLNIKLREHPSLRKGGEYSHLATFVNLSDSEIAFWTLDKFSFEETRKKRPHSERKRRPYASAFFQNTKKSW